MLLEFTQCCYNADTTSWSYVPIYVLARSIVGFYKHPEYDGSTVLLLVGSHQILIKESCTEVNSILEENASGNSLKWVYCEDHTPKVPGDYLVTTNKLSCSVDFDTFKDGKWKIYGNKVIAWMQIPKPAWMSSH